MRIANTFRFVTLISLVGLSSCEQVVIPDAELPSDWVVGEKVAKEFKVEDVTNLGLPLIAEGDKISVFSTMAPGDNCEFTYQNSGFSGEVVDAGSLIALYPYRSDATLVNEGGKLLLNTSIPYEQGICQVDETINSLNSQSRESADGETDINNSEENKKLDELYLSVNTGDGFVFNSLYTSVNLPIKSEYAISIDSIRIQANNGEHLSGEIGITFNGNSYSGIRTPEKKSDKVLYSGKLNIEKDASVDLKLNLLPEVYKKGFAVSLYKGNAAIAKEYNSEIDLSSQANYSLDEFVISLPDYYISYTSDTEISIDGYQSEYNDGEGKIYFSTSVVPDELFKGNTNVKSVTIPATITSIGNKVFDGCTNLGNVSFEDNSSLTTIGNAVFRGASFSKINIPASVVSIGNYAFQDNTNLTDLSFGNATFIEDGNNIVTSVESDSKLQTLGQQIIDGSNALNCDIVLPETIKDVTQTFYSTPTNENLSVYCLSDIAPKANNDSFNTFSKIFVVENALGAYKQAYAGFSNIKNKIYAIGTNPDAPEIEKTEYYVKYKSNVKVETSYTNEYNENTDEGVIYFENSTVPEGVFKGNTNITEIETSENITVLFDYCFTGCINLNNVILNEGLLTIGKQCMKNANLTGNLKIPASVVSIGNYAFENNVNLTSISFGNSNIVKDNEDNVISVTSDSNLETLGTEFLKGCSTIACDIVLPINIRDITKRFTSTGAPNKSCRLYCLSEVPPVSNDFGLFENIYYPNIYHDNYVDEYAAFSSKLKGFGSTTSNE